MDDAERRGGVSGERLNAKPVMYYKCQVTEKVHIFI
jgi:hypothetical protein